MPTRKLAHIARQEQPANRLVGGFAVFGYSIARVRGDSLEPLLRHGSIVLFRRRRSIRRGNVVLVEHPDIGRVVCKIGTVGRKGNVYLKGIPRCAIDAEISSRVPREAVIGAKVRRLF